MEINNILSLSGGKDSTAMVKMMVKERPIIFSTPMVQAILEGRKSQTRRIVKCHLEITDTATPNEWNIGRADDKMALFEKWGPRTGSALFKSKDTIFAMRCPYGCKGSKLWVRETWANVLFHKMFYKADDDRGLPKGCKWKPSIHMFKMYARIWLEITNIRVERLRDITYAEVIAEGFTWLLTDEQQTDSAHRREGVEVFGRFWDSINGKKHPWSDNPWVWVINFQKAPQGSILNHSKKKIVQI